MKKIFVAITAIALILTLSVSIFAFDGQFFEIDLLDGYSEVTAMNAFGTQYYSASKPLEDGTGENAYVVSILPNSSGDKTAKEIMESTGFETFKNTIFSITGTPISEVNVSLERNSDDTCEFVCIECDARGIRTEEEFHLKVAVIPADTCVVYAAATSSAGVEECDVLFDKIVDELVVHGYTYEKLDTEDSAEENFTNDSKNEDKDNDDKEIKEENNDKEFPTSVFVIVVVILLAIIGVLAYFLVKTKPTPKKKDEE